ncbi:MAG: cofactor-independent phosphoglycerate mutase [Candidatus Omnitrophica bacterium]|nr:cofactor-independent phosphoglycerate mutase [Candidatus Omnitrophota bacterium]
MKYIVIIPDGMADYPLEELNGRTPLQAARTTNMDYLAQNGFSGLVQTIPSGMKPGSDIGNMAILGYDPKKYHTGRAPLEAANQNILLKENEIAVRCNFVTIDHNEMSDYSAGHISTKEADILIKELNEQLGCDTIKFYTGKSYRHILVIKDENIEQLIKVQTAAPHDILGKDINHFLPKGKGSELFLEIMNKSKEILQNHTINQVRIDLKENPADMLWLWGQGTNPSLPAFKEKFGISGCIISAVDLINGIGRLAGLDIIDVPGITGYYDTNYLGKAEYAIKSLKKHDFVYIHVEAPDEAGHNGDARAKIAAIENIDREILGTILNHYDKHDDLRILLLPDHPTPVKLRTHTDDPVGFVLYGKGIQPDPTEKFNEATSKEKGLKFKSADELMNYFITKNQ